MSFILKQLIIFDPIDPCNDFAFSGVTVYDTNNIQFSISGGTPIYTVELVAIPSQAVIDSMFVSDGTYSFTNIAEGLYILKGLDENSCDIYTEQIHIAAITTTTTTTP